jgi:hypothetical protein
MFPEFAFGPAVTLILVAAGVSVSEYNHILNHSMLPFFFQFYSQYGLIFSSVAIQIPFLRRMQGLKVQ